jgi:hypothetical protein
LFGEAAARSTGELHSEAISRQGVAQKTLAQIRAFLAEPASQR